MAEAQEEEEHIFPLKRNPQDIPAEEAHEDDANKKQQSFTTDFSLAQKNKVDVEDEDDDKYEDAYESEYKNDEKDKESNREAKVDRKRKVMLRDDKGKGELIEHSDNDDSSDFGSESDATMILISPTIYWPRSIWVNIIPSTTHRHTHQSGLKISDDPVKVVFRLRSHAVGGKCITLNLKRSILTCSLLYG